ncbi:unnamed protein product [Medioppia subpectinata]|uniref:Uncharacterized protein n=1 Tax=Medioppia subpectinata TaxID=1979941 RepID=A0A7R9L109_9ACAR|nr:unnamed protein product [Medioppia subpectinata]CAG2112321.1 unnamed protein product [Medioppia subpectinata]
MEHFGVIVSPQLQQKQTPNESNKAKPTVPQESGDSSDLMLEEVDFGGLSSAKYDSKRRQLGEERRREYQEFLEQKSRFESENRNKRSKRVLKVEQNYKELLKQKRIEEHKRRELNGVEDMDIDGIEEQEYGKNGYTVPIVGQFYCSNNKFNPDYITPRSRLLATHSSRLKAQKYSEELRKQCEEKQLIKDEERERIRVEEEELEQRLEIQRLKLLREYEAEHHILREKARHSPHKEDVIKYKGHSIPIPSSPLSLLRSPTYMPLSEGQQLAASPATNKSKSVSRSLASAMSQSMPSKHTTAHKIDITDLNTSQIQNHSSDADSSSSEDEINEEQTKETEFRKRILSQLSEVRQMMETDHILMMEELRQQQMAE